MTRVTGRVKHRAKGRTSVAPYAYMIVSKFKRGIVNLLMFAAHDTECELSKY